MGISLGANQYGKAESRVVRVVRDSARHEIRDLNVSTSLRGDFSEAHVSGDQGAVLPTDTQKNTAFVYAKDHATGAIEDYALALAGHFVADVDGVRSARVAVEEYAWRRIDVDGHGHDHSFVRSGESVRSTIVTVDESDAWVVSGVSDLVIAKTTGSEFRGFLTDEYTTLADADDRILATSLVARWRYASNGVDWDATYAGVVDALLSTFATEHSFALQHSLYAMGEAALERYPAVAEIRFSAPNKHHFEVDLERFGVENNGEVFIAADRP
ncbi:MAG: urate oxidase, partial [Actinomycetia bacterium]|nr:urate oxidase [Actinomycetes bacterium]